MASPPENTFLVERQEAVLVRPSGLFPAGFLSLSTIDNDPNLDVICLSVYVYTPDQGEHPAVDVNGGEQKHSRDLWRSDPASLIKEGLSKALVHYYPLAGRLRRHEDGKLRVDCNGEGAPFSSATVSCTLASVNHLEGLDLGDVKQLVLRPEAGPGGAGAPPLMLQVTRFACGGFTVGLGLSHAVCDGFGSAQLLRAVAELAGGASEPSVRPVWERERLVAAPAPELRPLAAGTGPPATSPHLPSSDLVNGCFDVEAAPIGRLKRALQEESGQCNGSGGGGGGEGGFTTLEALGAFVWRSRFRALEMDPEGTTHFALAVSIRRDAMDPPLPEGYYGNAFVGSHTFLAGRELCEGPLWRAAAAIRESKGKAQEGKYVAPYLAMLERMVREGERPPSGGGASLVLTDWRHMGLAAAEFGGWRAVHVVPLPWDMFGYVDLCIFLPPFSLDAAMKGGVRVLLCLPRAAMARFEEDMAALRRLP